MLLITQHVSVADDNDTCGDVIDYMQRQNGPRPTGGNSKQPYAAAHTHNGKTNKITKIKLFYFPSQTAELVNSKLC